MKLEIKPSSGDTYTDVTAMVKEKGISWSFNSVDADGAGRSLDGVMHRIQIAIKNKLEVTCVPLTSTQMKALRDLLANEWLTIRVTTDDGTPVTFTGYRGATLSTAVLRSYGNKELWGGMKFSLIEQ